MNRTYFAAGSVALAVLCLSVSTGWFEGATAADHRDAPLTTSDPAADIADLYAFHDSNVGTLTTIFTYGGGSPVLPLYDADVLYTIHFDTDDDQVADQEIYVRFGQNARGVWGVQATGIPGTTAALSGAVGTTILGAGTTKLFAGLTDDPFFFDLQGFQDTLSTGTLAFDNTRDSFAGTNIMSVAVEMPLDLGLGTTPANIRVWATAGRN